MSGQQVHFSIRLSPPHQVTRPMNLSRITDNHRRDNVKQRVRNIMIPLRYKRLFARQPRRQVNFNIQHRNSIVPSSLYRKQFASLAPNYSYRQLQARTRPRSKRATFGHPARRFRLATCPKRQNFIHRTNRHSRQRRSYRLIRQPKQLLIVPNTPYIRLRPNGSSQQYRFIRHIVRIILSRRRS